MSTLDEVRTLRSTAVTAATRAFAERGTAAVGPGIGFRDGDDVERPEREKSVEMGAQHRCIRVERGPLRIRRQLRVDAQDVIADQAWMNVYVQVRHFLEGRLTDRMPETQALIGKRAADRASHASHHGHERGAGSVIELAHIPEMPPWNHERVAGVVLP